MRGVATSAVRALTSASTAGRESTDGVGGDGVCGTAAVRRVIGGLGGGWTGGENQWLETLLRKGRTDNHLKRSYYFASSFPISFFTTLDLDCTFVHPTT